MTARRPLTECAHEQWTPFLEPGDWAIDATAGNGHDTLLLARAVGPEGRVFAIDIQEAAIKSTARRLGAEGLLDRVTLVRGDHARMRDLLACGTRGRIKLICFNLGYLPTGDHAVTTHRESTLPALHEALLLLHPEGALSVMAYRGHPGGADEAAAVEGFFDPLPAPWTCRHRVASGSDERPGPVWWLAAAG